MWDFNYEESWALKSWCIWTMVLEKTLESPLDCKEIRPVHLKEISPGCSLEAEVEAENSNILATWCEELTHWKRFQCWEGLGAGGEGDYRGWDGWMASQTPWNEFEWTPGDGDRQGGLACCLSWCRKESDMTERLNWTELNWLINRVNEDFCG